MAFPGNNPFPYPLHPDLGLPIFPPGSSLRFNASSALLLTDKDRILLDNLWTSKNSSSFPKIMHTLASHLNFLNQSMLQAEMNSSSISLRPHCLKQEPGLSAYLEKERQLSIARTELEQLQKDKKEILEKKQKIENEFQILKKDWTDEKQKEEANIRLQFPQTPPEIKARVFKLVLSEKHEEFCALQNMFHELVSGLLDCPPGLGTSIMTFQRPKHPNEAACTCYYGFVIVRVSLFLSEWEDVTIRGITLTAKKLFDYGLISRLVITNATQVEQVRPFSWRLAYCCNKIFKTALCVGGFINLEICSIPPWFEESYNLSAKHEILLKTFKYAIPVKETVQLDPEDRFLLNEQVRDHLSIMRTSPIPQQLGLWRSLMLSTSSCWSEHMNMLFEESSMKVFSPAWNLKLCVPFGGIILHNPAEIEHLRTTKGSWHSILDGDHADHNIPEDGTYVGDNSEQASEHSLGPEEEHNLINRMEG